MLEDYIFDDHLRYQGHKLIYTFPKPTEEPIVIGGILGAAILCVRLINTDEQHSREIVLDEKLHYEPFYIRYEQEVIGDDWGYIAAELEQLDLAYMELYSQEQVTIETLCPNIRQLSIAMDVLQTYMHRISIEQYGEHIYDLVKWTMPFAQWLYNAAQVEPLRQRFLTMVWTNPALVHALAEDITNGVQEAPFFLFLGEQAADIMQLYWKWIMDAAQRDAALYPDANVILAENKEMTLSEETDYDFLQPQLQELEPKQRRLFTTWMDQWIAFVKQQLAPAIVPKKRDVRQELELDNILPVPPERNYVKVREYIIERCKYDKNFEKFYKSHKMTQFCDQLSLLFDWYVDPNALGKRMKSKPKK